MKIKIIILPIGLLFFTSFARADFNEYVLGLYDDYQERERQCLVEAQANTISYEEIAELKEYKQKDIEAYAIKKGIDYKIQCTSKEMVQVLHAGWVAHRVSVYDKLVNNFDYILDDIVDPRYLDAIIHLGGASEKTLNGLEQIEYFQKPFDIESRPWE